MANMSPQGSAFGGMASSALQSARSHASTMPEEWKAAVVTNLSTADSSHQKAVDNMQTGMLAVRATNAEQGKHRDHVHAHFTQKIANTKELVQQLSSRISSMQKTIQHTEWSLKRLEEAKQLLVSPLEVCRKRLELREKLPRRERVADPFQDALHQEEKEILAAKGRYMQAISDTQRNLRELKQKQQDLEVDLRDKKHAQHLDTMCVDKKARDVHFPTKLDKSYDRQGGVPVKQPLPELTGGREADTPGREQERYRQKSTLHSVEAALASESSARTRWADTSNLMDATSKIVKAAYNNSQAELAKKVEHTEVLTEELIKVSKCTSQKMAGLANSLNLAQEKIMGIDKPISANLHREQIRSRRAPREAHLDQVSEALHGQQQMLQSKKMSLQSQAGSMHAALNELGHTNKMLLDDIADKTRALEIERSCAAVRNNAHGGFAYGFSRVGTGQKHLADTATSKMRQTHPLASTRFGAFTAR